MKQDPSPQINFGFHSVFARLFISVFLAIIAFAIAMILLAQVMHNNSSSTQSQVIAGQVVGQIDPFLTEINQAVESNNHLQARFILAVVKKSFDIFGESLNAKIGLYDQQKRLILQTEDSELPDRLPPTPSWLSETLPTLSGKEFHHATVKSATGYTVWYESRKPPKEKPFMGMLNLFTGTVLLIIIMTAMLWWLSHSMTQRLNIMAQKIKLLGDGDFSVRVDEVGNDEISALAHGFNQSAQKIEQLINANSLLLAHASHEFRTPITRIRLQIEMMDMLAQKLDDDSKAKFDKRATAVNRDLTGLNDLVESILLVSRLDAGHALQNSEQVDFEELVKNECQHYPEATLLSESISILAQPKLLTHLVRNLLNNAIIHGIAPIEVYVYGAGNMDDAKTIPKSLIDLSSDSPTAQNHDSETPNSHDSEPMQPDDDSRSSRFLKTFTKKEKNKNKPSPNFAVLAVIDQGEGIAVDKRTDIFSPFVRLKQEKKGSGLGLSLVAQIVEAHHGQILTDTWQGKTRFLAILPTSNKTFAPSGTTDALSTNKA